MKIILKILKMYIVYIIPLNIFVPFCSGMDVAAPAGAICSNAVDMAKWMMFHLSGGLDIKGRRLVPEADFHEMHTPQMPTPMPLGKKLLKQPIFPISEGRYAYNLGWSSGLYRGEHTTRPLVQIYYLW